MHVNVSVLKGFEADALRRARLQTRSDERVERPHSITRTRGRTNDTRGSSSLAAPTARIGDAVVSV